MTSYPKVSNKPKPRYTPDELKALEAAIERYRAITQELDRLTADQAAERARILELTLDKVTDDNKVVAPGITVASRTKVTFEPAAALAWLLTPDETGQMVNLYTAGGMLTINPEAMGLLAAQVIANPSLKTVLAIDNAGYKAAIAKGTHKDAPYTSLEIVPTLSISEQGLKTGADLRALVEVVREES